MEIISDHHHHHLLAISGFLTLILVYNLWRVRDNNHKTKNGQILPPEPKGSLPILGHLHLLGKEKTLARSLARLADKYGPVFSIWLGAHRTVVISNHDAIKECFTTNDKVLASRPKSSHGKYLSYNYAAFGFASYGPYWRNIRKTVMIQLLSSHRIKSLRHVQVFEVNNLIKDLYSLCRKLDHNNYDQAKIVISECFEHLTVNMITRMIAGKRYFNSEEEEEEEGRRIRKLMKEYMYVSGVSVPSDLVPFVWWMDYLPGPVKDMKRLARELDIVMESWIDEHKLKRLKKDESKNVMEEEDFIDVMLSILEDDYFGHSRENIIKGTVMTLIIAGADTTSITLTWILSNLLNNRHTLELAQQELDLKVGRDRCVQHSDIDNLLYIQAIVKETLRLFPPGPLGVPHQATQDCSIAGYHIPKGTRIFPNLWKLHRDPDIWSNPHQFMPERFLTNHVNLDVSGQNFEYLPFGSGRRSCPGLNFATQAIHFTVARLIQAFDITTPSNESVDMAEGFGITLPKATPLEIQIAPRLPPQLYEF